MLTSTSRLEFSQIIYIIELNLKFSQNSANEISGYDGIYDHSLLALVRKFN